MRIISLVPSLTKTVCDFGFKDEIVGITNFCIDPPDLYKRATRIGGTKDPDLAKIGDLKPTHVIVNEEENTRDCIHRLKQDFNVLSTFPKSPQDVPSLLREIGEFLGCFDIADKQAMELEALVQDFQLSDLWRKKFGRRFLYLIWRNPWMAAGEDTYISRFLNLLGLENSVKKTDRYPVLTPNDVRTFAADVVFMSSEPWPFRKRDVIAWRQEMDSKPDEKIFWIDGKCLSWYGSTTMEALKKAYDIQKLVKALVV